MSLNLFDHIFSLVEKGSESLIKYLIEKGADVNATDVFRTTALRYAVEDGKFLFMIT